MMILPHVLVQKRCQFSGFTSILSSLSHWNDNVNLGEPCVRLKSVPGRWTEGWTTVFTPSGNVDLPDVSPHFFLWKTLASMAPEVVSWPILLRNLVLASSPTRLDAIDMELWATENKFVVCLSSVEIKRHKTKSAEWKQPAGCPPLLTFFPFYSPNGFTSSSFERPGHLRGFRHPAQRTRCSTAAGRALHANGRSASESTAALSRYTGGRSTLSSHSCHISSLFDGLSLPPDCK